MDIGNVIGIIGILFSFFFGVLSLIFYKRQQSAKRELNTIKNSYVKSALENISKQLYNSKQFKNLIMRMLEIKKSNLSDSEIEHTIKTQQKGFSNFSKIIIKESEILKEKIHKKDYDQILETAYKIEIFCDPDGMRNYFSSFNYPSWIEFGKNIDSEIVKTQSIITKLIESYKEN